MIRKFLYCFFYNTQAFFFFFRFSRKNKKELEINCQPLGFRFAYILDVSLGPPELSWDLKNFIYLLFLPKLLSSSSGLSNLDSSFNWSSFLIFLFYFFDSTHTHTEKWNKHLFFFFNKQKKSFERKGWGYRAKRNFIKVPQKFFASWSKC